MKRRVVGIVAAISAVVVITVVIAVYSPVYQDNKTFKVAERFRVPGYPHYVSEPGIKAYLDYLNRYPQGRHVQEVMMQLVNNLGNIQPPPNPSAPPGSAGGRAGGSWFAAGEALCQIGLPALPALTQGLKHEDRFVRMWSAEVLGGMGTAAESAIPQLIDALEHDSNPAVRESCAWAVATVGAQRSDVITAIEKAAKQDPEGFVRGMVIQHLKKARVKPQQPPGWPRHIALHEIAWLGEKAVAWMEARCLTPEEYRLRSR